MQSEVDLRKPRQQIVLQLTFLRLVPGAQRDQVEPLVAGGVEQGLRIAVGRLRNRPDGDRNGFRWRQPELLVQVLPRLLELARQCERLVAGVEVGDLAQCELVDLDIAAFEIAPTDLEQAARACCGGLRQALLGFEVGDATAEQARLVRRQPLVPGDVVAHLDPLRLGGAAGGAACHEAEDVPAEAQVVGVDQTRLRAGRVVEPERELGIGQQTGVEHLRFGHPILGAHRLQIRIDQHRDHREFIAGQRPGKVERDRRNARVVQLLCLLLEKLFVGCRQHTAHATAVERRCHVGAAAGDQRRSQRNGTRSDNALHGSGSRVAACRPVQS